jgi:hypothetical protein
MVDEMEVRYFWMLWRNGKPYKLFKTEEEGKKERTFDDALGPITSTRLDEMGWDYGSLCPDHS